MKKHLILAGILAATVTSSAHADLITVAVNGGYSTVTMADVNDRGDKGKKSLEALGATAKYTPLSSGWFVAAEAGLGLLPFLELGPRIEYLQTNQGEMSADFGGIKSSLLADATLSSFMLGANVGVDLPLTGLGFSAGAFGGYGYAVVKNSFSVGGTPAGGNLYSGGAFVGELQAKLKYSIIPLLSAHLMAGIRMANIGQLKDGATTSTESFDFSGINAGGGISLGF
jgi:hypothetical protein